MSIFALFIDWLPLLHLEITLTDSTYERKTSLTNSTNVMSQNYFNKNSRLESTNFRIVIFREIAKVENTEWRKREAVLGYVMIEVISLI